MSEVCRSVERRAPRNALESLVGLSDCFSELESESESGVASGERPAPRRHALYSSGMRLELRGDADGKNVTLVGAEISDERIHNAVTPQSCVRTSNPEMHALNDYLGYFASSDKVRKGWEARREYVDRLLGWGEKSPELRPYLEKMHRYLVGPELDRRLAGCELHVESAARIAADISSVLDKTAGAGKNKKPKKVEKMGGVLVRWTVDGMDMWHNPKVEESWISYCDDMEAKTARSTPRFSPVSGCMTDAVADIHPRIFTSSGGSKGKIFSSPADERQGITYEAMHSSIAECAAMSESDSHKIHSALDYLYKIGAYISSGESIRYVWLDGAPGALPCLRDEESLGFSVAGIDDIDDDDDDDDSADGSDAGPDAGASNPRTEKESTYPDSEHPANRSAEGVSADGMKKNGMEKHARETRKIRTRLRKAIRGEDKYKNIVGNGAAVWTMELRKLSDGKAAITDMEPSTIDEYIGRIRSFIAGNSWYISYVQDVEEEGKPTRRVSKRYYGCRSPRWIAEALFYDADQENAGVKRRIGAITDAIVAARLDGADFPSEILENIVQTVEKESDNHGTERWRNLMETACGAIAGELGLPVGAAGRFSEVAHMTDRDVLLGRMLALYEMTEKEVNRRRKKTNKVTTTAAMMRDFRCAPASTLTCIANETQFHVNYIAEKHPALHRAILKMEGDIVRACLSREDALSALESDEPVGRGYLLGYHHQIEVFNEELKKANWKKKNASGESPVAETTDEETDASDESKVEEDADI